MPQALWRFILSYVLTLGGEFDVVLNLDGFNEVALPIAENLHVGVFPLYPRAWPQLAQQGSDPEQLARIGQLTYLQSRRRDAAAALQGSWIRTSALATMMWRWSDLRPARRIQAIQHQLNTEADASRGYKETGPPYDAPSRESLRDTVVGYWETCSLQMFAVGAVFDFHFVHALQPNQYVPGSKPFSQEEKRIAIDSDHPYRLPVEIGYPGLRNALNRLAERGVHTLDLTGALVGHRETLHIDDCCHFNPEGHLIIGTLIGQAIVERMPPSAVPPKAD